MDTHDDDLQAAWWKTCDFIASAADTLLFLACLAASFFARLWALIKGLFK